MTVDKRGDPFWEELKVGGYAQMLGGQTGPMAFRESFEGVLVFDGRSGRRTRSASSARRSG